AEYDTLFRQLVELEERHPALRSATSPTQRVGAAPADRFATVRHSLPMLSLDNAMSADEFREFDARVRKLLRSDSPVEYVAEPKLDGMAVELVYLDGVLSVASRRGDLSAAGIRAAQRRARRGRGPAVRQSAQCRRRLAAPARLAHHRQTAARYLLPQRRAARRGDLRLALGVPDRTQGLGSQGQPAESDLPRGRGGGGLPPGD